MGDVFSKQKRSEVMSAIRSKHNKETELILVAILRKHKITGWRRHLSLSGRPDFAFRESELAVFVDGCFWHGCPKHYRLPRSNESYWTDKIKRNHARDHSVSRALRLSGWKVLRIWQHELRDERRIVKRILAGLSAKAPR